VLNGAQLHAAQRAEEVLLFNKQPNPTERKTEYQQYGKDDNTAGGNSLVL
jgi:hypothetical protein